MRKIAVIIVIAIVVLAAVTAYIFLRPRVSPAATASISANGTTITAYYSRPAQKGRLLFGTKEEGALVPFGEIWRTGANEATEIEFSRDVWWNGAPVKAGRYALFTIPQSTTWTVILNKKLGQWGAFFYDEKDDYLRTQVQSLKTTYVNELFSITLSPDGSGAQCTLAWGETSITVPILTQQPGTAHP